ncbi:MAG: ABC transporter substrate-binding protein [Actinomycetota bacterium]|nr:ABC transporter substrate-binding protein [Actinomycetota bacterium]
MKVPHAIVVMPLLVLLAAACGTTVPGVRQAAGLGGLAAPAADGVAGLGGSSPGGYGAGTGSGAGPARTSVGNGLPVTASGPAPVSHSGTAAGLGQAATPGAVPVTGRGWDARHVYIGVLTQKDFQKTFAAAGYSGIDPGDTQAQAQAVVDAVNRSGGILGRTVSIRTDDIPTVSSAQNPDAAGQAACTYFTQDQPVVAVFNIIHTLDKTAFRACLAKYRMPLLDGALSVVAKADAAKLAPYFYSLGTPTWDVLAPVLVQRLRAQGYFGGWDARLSKPAGTAPTLGVLVADTPLGHADEAILTASLKSAGYRNVVTYAYAPPGNQIDGAVLYFAQSGVTHVISDDIELVTFQLHAQSQHYAPRYGIHTYNAPSTNLEGIGPPSQQVGDVGVGWGPHLRRVHRQRPRCVQPRCHRLPVDDGQGPGLLVGPPGRSQRDAHLRCDPPGRPGHVRRGRLLR